MQCNCKSGKQYYRLHPTKIKAPNFVICRCGKSTCKSFKNFLFIKLRFNCLFFFCMFQSNVFFFNVLTVLIYFQICGIALIIIGALVHNETYTYFLNSKYVTAPNILIAIGCIIFVLAFLGCCGAVKENHCMVMTVSIFKSLPAVDMISSKQLLLAHCFVSNLFIFLNY